MPKATAAPKEVSFDVTREEEDLIQKIVERAIPGKGDRLGLSMDLTACHANGCKLDLKKLLVAPEFTFWHDIGGITRHINRTTGKLNPTFLPRCHA